MSKILSISIAAYNVEKYIQKTLDSLVSNKAVMDKVEVIIVDDGSIDRTADIAQEYVDEYPMTFRMVRKENGGHGSTLNLAARLASGKYFRMLDGDDWYKTEEFEKFVLQLEKLEADVVLTPYQQAYETGGVDVIDRHELANGIQIDIEKDGPMTNVAEAPEITVKTSILKNHCFEILEKCMYTDVEYDLFIGLYARTYLKLPYPVYCYRLGLEGQSVSMLGRRKHLFDAEKVVLSALKKIVDNRKDIVNNLHKKYLYSYIYRTAIFQCESLLYACCEEEILNELLRFVEEMRVIDSDFADYIENSAGFQWCKWAYEMSRQIKGHQCTIFGAGRCGEKIYQFFNNMHIEICALLDNNEDLWGKEKWGILILRPEEAVTKYRNTQIVISVKNQPESIIEQLVSLGVEEERIIAFRK